MQVFLVRHAAAVAETVELRDPNRHLTPDGRTHARMLGERMGWYDCKPTRVWTSPLARALQTTELVVASMNCSLPVEIVPALAPDGDVRQVVAAIRALPPDGAALIVGHEPSLSAIAGLLLGIADFPSLAKTHAVRIVDGRVRWRFAYDAESPERETA